MSVDKKYGSEARDRLPELPGAGDKLADCVLLFGCGRREVFPVDVRAERLTTSRFDLRQYLFHAARTGAIEL